MWPLGTPITALQLLPCDEHAISPLGDPVPLPVKWELDLLLPKISSRFLKLLADECCAEHYLGYTALILENLLCDQEDMLSSQQIYFSL